MKLRSRVSGKAATHCRSCIMNGVTTILRSDAVKQTDCDENLKKGFDLLTQLLPESRFRLVTFNDKHIPAREETTLEVLNNFNTGETTDLLLHNKVELNKANHFTTYPNERLHVNMLEHCYICLVSSRKTCNQIILRSWKGQLVSCWARHSPHVTKLPDSECRLPQVVRLSKRSI